MLTVGQLGEGEIEGTLTVNGEEAAPLGRDGTALFLAGGVNKVTVTATSDRLVLDRLSAGPGQGRLMTTVFPAKEGSVTGDARVTGAYPLAMGGKAVDGIGRGPANALGLSVTAGHSGRYALTIRYSNGEQAPATHYNSDPLCRHADLSVNGAAAQRARLPGPHRPGDTDGGREHADVHRRRTPRPRRRHLQSLRPALGVRTRHRPGDGHAADRSSLTGTTPPDRHSDPPS
ncbi:hypothetical protein ABT186_35695 [Streptomyces sp. NPDC001634]|uniref:hypothetical protein n=1 Tax=Streptomyces sp. NPDC001634 TaxID=3154390 RepID=UPI00332B78EC